MRTAKMRTFEMPLGSRAAGAQRKLLSLVPLKIGPFSGVLALRPSFYADFRGGTFLATA